MGRQQSKDDKRARIRDAAASLFVERGYAGTTTSMVAERAGVAKGTLFLYAATKEDLVGLVFADRLGGAVARALETLPTGASLVDEAMHVFSTFFALYAPTPELARIFVREMMFPEPAVAKVRDAVDARLLEGLAARIARRVEAGELAAVAPPSFVAALWFGHYVVALIAWLAGALPSVEVAESSLRLALSLSVRGLSRIEEKGTEPCTPPRKKPKASTSRPRRSARTAGATSKRTASGTAATTRSGSR